MSMSVAPPSLLSTLLPPLAAGIGYAAAKSLGKGAGWGGLYWQSPVMFSFLAGLLIALGLRPILTRVPWQRGAAFGLVLAGMLAIGPAGDWCEARLLAWSGVLGFPYDLPASALPELLGALAAAGLLAWLHRPSGGTIGLGNLRARLARLTGVQWLIRLSLLGIAAVTVAGVTGGLDALLSRQIGLPPMDPTNPWLRLWTLGAATVSANGVSAVSYGAGGTAALAVLALGWLRGLALILPLVPIALVLRGTRTQIALVFTLVLFIIGEFAPLMENQPYPSASWLLVRVGIAAVGAAAIGTVTAWLIGQTSAPAEPG